MKSMTAASLLGMLIASGAGTLNAQGIYDETVQRSGSFFNLHVGSQSFTTENASAVSGAVFGGEIGYAFGRFVSAYLGGDVGGLEDDVLLVHVELGGRLNLDVARLPVPIVPYAQFAIAALGTGTVDSDSGRAGVGFLYGGGVQYFLTPRFGIDAGFKRLSATMKTVDTGAGTVLDSPGESSSSNRFLLGVTFYPRSSKKVQ